MATTQPDCCAATAAVCLDQLPKMLSNTGAAMNASDTAIATTLARQQYLCGHMGQMGLPNGLQHSSLLSS